MTTWWQRAFQALQGEAGAAPAGPLLRGAAAALALCYGLGSRSRRRLYDRGWLAPQRLPAPVLSVGNLTVGGTGKTPFTAFLARSYQAAGCRPVILSRGYGGRTRGCQVVSDGCRLRLQPPLAGDEAYLLAAKLPGVPVVTGSNRHQAGLLAWEVFRPDLFLLDDGFQHFQLHRDLDVVLVDADRPFGNGRLLPRGPLREPVATLTRPLVLALSRYEDRRHRPLWQALREAFPAATVVRVAFHLQDAVRHPGGPRQALAALAGIKLAGLASLARPEVFAASLQAYGLELQRLFVFPDHHPYSAQDVAQVVAAAREEGAAGLITTEKDWVRLARVWSGDLPLYVVPLSVSLLDDWPEHLFPLACQGG
jgi:tetraacyldisaccharide 4'-kinase